MVYIAVTLRVTLLCMLVLSTNTSLLISTKQLPLKSMIIFPDYSSEFILWHLNFSKLCL